MDWNKCIICGGGGEVKCPAKSLDGNAQTVYDSFLDAAREFKGLGQLPVALFINVDEYQAQELLDNYAKWH